MVFSTKKIPQQTTKHTPLPHSFMKRTSLKTLILAFAAICAFPCSGMANDGLFYTSGNQLVPLNESQISVSKEVLTIRLNANGTATVDVQYDFLNPEKEERCVTVGFVADAPQNFTGQQLQETEHPFIKDFTVEMNDTALSFRHATVANDSTFVNKLEFKPLDLSLYEEDESGSGNYLTLQDTHLGTSISYVYYFQATFKPGLNHVHHRYTYTMAQNVYTHYLLDYKLSPALRWANHQINDFTLRIESDGSPLHFFLNAASMKGTDAPAIVNAAGKKGYGKHQMRDIRSSEYDKQAQQMLEFFLRDASVEIHAKDFKAEEELHLSAADCSESGIVCMPDPCKTSLVAAKSETPLSALDKLAAKHYLEALQGKTFLT